MSKASRKNYSPRKLEEAVKRIKDGASVCEVARDTHIPKTTLIYKSKGKRPEKYSKPGPKSLLGKLVHKFISLNKLLKTN